jgi:hypothetical protein
MTRSDGPITWFDPTDRGACPDHLDLAQVSGRMYRIDDSVSLRIDTLRADLPRDRDSGPRQNPKAERGGKAMFHILWYLIIGLLAGLISKSVMHVHMTLFWTIVLGIIGSILGGGVTRATPR